MKRVDSFGAIDCQLVKPAEAAKIIHEAIAETGASAFDEQGRAPSPTAASSCSTTRASSSCGRRYGICGKNGRGKTTLMRNVNIGKIEGMDPDLVSVFVESHADEDPDDVLCVREWTTKRPELVERGAADEGPAVELLKSVGFSDELLATPVGNLSGGWRMKLSLVVAALMDADILLLDEPTNHLDAKSVEWLQRYLCSCRACCMIVSHDTGFLDATCTDIIHYEERKLALPRNLSARRQGAAGAPHYELSESGTKFAFPAPGRLEGIATTTKAIVKLENATFTWPGRDVPTISDCSCKLTLGSRVCVLGENGAGKSTLIKLLVGENGPDNGDTRSTPRCTWTSRRGEYLQWRFGKFIDQETLNTALEELKRKQAQATFAEPVRPLPFTFEKIMGRREGKGGIEYEVKFWDRPERQNLYIEKERLSARASPRRCLFDMLAASAAGLDLINATVSELQAHLDEFGLPQEFGTYGKVRGLSGGQKVKLVLAAAMWNRPHLLILDEPTNYLDRDSLGALSNAIKDFGGGVVMISHCHEFYAPLCNEEWHVAAGKLAVKGEAADRELKVGKKKRESKSKAVEKTTGSVNEEIKIVVPKDFWGKSLSKKDARSYEKAAKKRDVALMRKILQVPKGKTMPGAPELGDGTGN
ncbi:ATPase [Aureococcus anophagefferens]|nr:ATPase [Aureococcus anophagefferens]